MKPTRRLALKREALVELNVDQLGHVVGADATIRTLCETQVTVLQPGCASDPQVCYYQTFPCSR